MSSTGPRIFISYRREDTAGHAGRLYDRLSDHFGDIFMDIDTIEPGADFVEVIEEAVGSSDVLIALIGEEWLSATDASGRRRLDNPEDFVRLEIVAALGRKVRVIPVLVQDAAMPGKDELPDALAGLARRNALEVSDERWQYDVGRLIEAIEKGRPGSGVADVVVETTPEESGTEDIETRRQVPPVVWWFAGAAAVLLVVVVIVALAGSQDDDNGRNGLGILADTRIAFLSDKTGGCEIHAVDADGTGVTQLTHNNSLNLRPDWSPDGKRVAFASNQEGDYDIYVLDVASGTETKLIDNGGDEKGPDWSPDGSKIAFSSAVGGESAIWVVNDDGTGVTQLTDASQSVTPDWSPDGSRIAFADRSDGSVDIHIIDADGTNRVNLTEGLFGVASSQEFDPTWSPDGQRIAFDVKRAGEDFDIFTASPAGESPENLTAHSGNDRHASWSPDGSKVVFGSDRLVPEDDTEQGCSADERQQDLFVMNADGTDQARLIRTEADDSSPAWSPLP